ncbi:MAG: 50S ribosomal protein L13 [Dehalococcoidia bacterium]|nr:50S ribosomal protein L13 [Dehalococcoidia bacterium]
MKTYSTKASDIKREWHLIDATGQTLGRLASHVATLLKGKHKPMYVPHLDTGDFVVIINAAKIKVGGKKYDQKMYYSHSQYPSGLKTISFAKLAVRHPTGSVEHAIRGMLPHNVLGRAMFKKLKVYANGSHPHAAQFRMAVGSQAGSEA